jgi:hypothetical protein
MQAPRGFLAMREIGSREQHAVAGQIVVNKPMVMEVGKGRGDVLQQRQQYWHQPASSMDVRRPLVATRHLLGLEAIATCSPVLG